MYYFVYIFQHKSGTGYSNCVVSGIEKVTKDIIDNICDSLYEDNKEGWTDKPIIINWKRLDE